MLESMMKSALKSFLLRFSPQMAGALRTWWQRRHVQAVQQRLGLPQIATSFVERHGLRVLSGPFEGMTYVPQAVGSTFTPKLLGSYESELHDVIEQIADSACPVIVDIGCAEGYYAVGLARRLPSSCVYAFDLDPHGRKLCAAMAQTNGVASRVAIDSQCDAAALNGLLHTSASGGAIIISDCEGCEYELLRPALVPHLSRAFLLVELHSSENPQQPQAFLREFETSHHVVLLQSRERDAALYPALEFLAPAQRAIAISELRQSGQQWAWMTPKSLDAIKGASGAP